MAKEVTPPKCATCDTNERVTLVSGALIYPNRKDLHRKAIWHCDTCLGYVGCHPNSTVPLGYPADSQTRKARSQLHDGRLDPIWKRHKTKRARNEERNKVYAFLGKALNLLPGNCHVGMFTLEQCREAWKALAHYPIEGGPR